MLQHCNMEKKQTAVDWLATYLKGITSLNCDEVIEQAKAMEKEQIIEAHINSAMFEMDSDRYAEQYYNEKFAS